ncbi:MAG: hypothetical protein SCARUB_00587, partial [Candidatus Scalindua rubra]
GLYRNFHFNYLLILIRSSIASPSPVPPPGGEGRVRGLSAESRLLFDHAVAQNHFGGSVFWMRHLASLDGEQTNIEHWQIKRDGSQVIAQYQVELCTLPFGRIPALTLGIPAKAGLTHALNSMKFHLILSNYEAREVSSK